MNKTCNLKVLWKNAPEKGTVEIVRGKLLSIKTDEGKGKTDGNGFNFSNAKNGILKIAVSGEKTDVGAFGTIVKVASCVNPFSLFLRDALYPETPIWISEYEVAVTTEEDLRSYHEITKDIAAKNILSDFARFDAEPEESYEAASSRNRKQMCPTWLGIGRDMRIFRVCHHEKFGYWGKIEPCYHTTKHRLDRNSDEHDYFVNFVIGQGSSCQVNIERRLEDGCLPILHSIQKESFMHYNVTAFATLETQTLESGNVRGSDWQAVYANSGGNMLGEEGKEKIKDLLDKEMYEREEELVLRCRIEAVNTGKTPCYAWLKAPFIGHWKSLKDFDGKNGFSIIENWGVFAITLANGKAAPDEELAILVQPGEKTTFDLIVPHSPISKERALKLRKTDYEEHYSAVRKFWNKKLSKAASFNLPEKEINNIIKAGLLHCDIAALGMEPDGPVAATIGWYSPIGTESAPIIQYFDSVGLHKLAERCIQFFFERQQENGFIQNFARYESETGPLLWTAGEHFRYTKDVEWLKRVMPNIKKAADYLLKWRERNKKEEYREKGFYGMVDGKVADPDDYYHSFFLNAGTYVGLKRIAEITENIDSEYSKKLTKEVLEYKKDIKNGFYFAQANAPLVPTGNGSWAPLMPPWVEQTGGITLYADGGNWFSHAAFASRSCLTGPLWLIISEALDAEEIGSDFMLKSNQFPITLENACLSQPYYCRHDFAHLKRGEVKPFLKTFYNQLTALMDRETYTFWEHYYEVSQHKTHEEGWFLMQTRWMLYMEDDSSLKLFSGIPRNWLESGKEIKVENAASYFGKISFKAESKTEQKVIAAQITCHDSDNIPKKVEFRLPHPKNLKAASCEGGAYKAKDETVVIENFQGSAEIKLTF